jgi:hypothetical protein
MIRSVRHLECVEKVVVLEVNSLRSIREVSKSIGCLLFSPNDLLSSLFLEVSFILPKVECFLSLRVVLEKTRGVSFDVLVEELLRRQCLVVANVCFVCEWEEVGLEVFSQISLFIHMPPQKQIHAGAHIHGLLVQSNKRQERKEVENDEELESLSKAKANLIVLMLMRLILFWGWLLE